MLKIRSATVEDVDTIFNLIQAIEFYRQLGAQVTRKGVCRWSVQD